MKIVKYIIFQTYILPNNKKIKISVTEKMFVLEKKYTYLPIFCEEMKVISNRITLADVYF